MPSAAPPSRLETHAEFELRRAGLFDESSDYGGAIGLAVMDLVRVFSAEHHSGMSAQVTLELFNLVASFKTLTPITDDPGEWADVAEMVVASVDGVKDGPKLYQNLRDSSCFSEDGGKTYYDIDADDDRALKDSAPSDPSRS